MCLWKAVISSHTSTKTTYHNRVIAEAGIRIQLSSVNQDIKKICKCKTVVLNQGEVVPPATWGHLVVITERRGAPKI